MDSKDESMLNALAESCQLVQPCEAAASVQNSYNDKPVAL
jgi:hypothetical protein